MKTLDIDLKLKLSGKRLYPTESVKYLGIKMMKTSLGLIILMILLLSLTGLMLCYLKGVCKY